MTEIIQFSMKILAIFNSKIWLSSTSKLNASGENVLKYSRLAEIFPYNYHNSYYLCD